jgi:hypothetical protein
MVTKRECNVLIFKGRQKIVLKQVDEPCCSGVVHLDSQECILFFFEANDSIVYVGAMEWQTIVPVCITHLISYVTNQRTSFSSIKKGACRSSSEVTLSSK